MWCLYNITMTDEETELTTEVADIPKVKAKKVKQDKENPTSIYLKDYVGSGAGLGELSYKKLEAVGVTTVYDVLIRGIAMRSEHIQKWKTQDLHNLINDM